jgi:hypothetical protein
MTLDATLRKFNAKAFEPVHQEISGLEKEIAAYQKQKKITNRLAVAALATFVFFTLKLTWNKLSGTEFKVAAFSTSSLLLGFFNLIIGGSALLSLIDGKTKAKRFAEQISAFVGKTTKSFYGEMLERRQDLVTPSEVLESIQENLRPLLKNPVHVEKDYILITTYQISLEGDSAENFKCSSTKVTDNSKEIETAVAVWRSYYSELYQAEPTSRKLPLMQVIASQCIQGVAPLTIIDGTSHYACSSPAIQNPQSGNISHYYQPDTTGKRNTFSSLAQFRQYLDNLPKVRFFAPFPLWEMAQ